jgi:hypothetical protein
MALGGDVGCQDTDTCLFTVRSGRNWEYCGDIYSTANFGTDCRDYPTYWYGVSPLDVIYWLV